MAGKGKGYELKVQIGGEVESSFGKAFSKAERELATLYKFSRRTNQGFLDGVDRLDSFANKTFAVMAKGAAAASAGLAGVLTASTMAGSSFEAQMSTVQAISQASSGDMKQLKEVAAEMGRTTKFSATEAGQGLEYMAMAGWKTQEMVSGLPGIMYLAAASGEELGTVSDIVTDAMTAFGLQADQSAHFADVLAQASSSSNTNVAMMGATFQYVAPVAGSFGYTIEDVATATGLMANAGIKGEKAGTAMRTMLTNLAKPTKQMRGYMNKLSLSLVDSTGKMKPFRQQLQELRQGFSGLSEAERAEYAAGIAGKEGMSGLLAMVNASEADFTKLTAAIDNSAGAAKEMSEVRLDNLEGDVTILKSGLEGVGIEIYGGFSSLLREGVQDATAWLSSFTENLKEDIPTIRREAKNFAKVAESLFGPFLDAGKWLLKHPGVIEGSIKGTAAAMLTFKAAKGATAAVKLLGTLSGMMSAWPVAAAGLIIGGIVGISSAMERTAKKKAAKNLAEHFGDLTLSMEELNEAARHLVGDRLFDNIEAMESSAGRADNFFQSMKDSLKSIQKMEWKLSMGMELDTSDAESYASAVDSYVTSAQDYIAEKGYELNLAVELVLGDSGQGFAEDSSAFYQSLLAQMNPLKQDISKALEDITENGLTLDKQKIVDDYLAEMADITSMITDAQNAAKLQMIEGQFAGAALTPETFQNLQSAIADYTEQANQSADEAYQTILTSLNAQRIAGERGTEGGITQAEFDEKSAEAAAGYYRRKAETILNGYQTMQDTIMATYGSEIQPAMDAINQKISDALAEAPQDASVEELLTYLNQAYAGASEALESFDLSDGAKDAVNMLLQGMKPTTEQLQGLEEQIKASGGDIAVETMKGITAAFSDQAALTAITGTTEDMWTVIGTQVARSAQFSDMAQIVADSSGPQFPEGLQSGIDSQKIKTEQTIGQYYRQVGNEIKRQFLQPFTVDIKLDSVISDGGIRRNVGAPYRDPAGKKPAHYASGGLIEKPTLSYFAEESPEMAIPIDGSRNATELWKETGRLLGLYQENNYGVYSKAFSGAPATSSGFQGQTAALPTYSPVFNLYGSAGREEVEDAEQASFERFKEWFLRFEESRSRMSF
ncbi:phage tail tape measure protein [[Clostridium] symbiosum]|jgi:TP901 family phage tail tape measure protein|uniref:phage tail tape measure protein n=3 Tax=Clostridium symbiosum TaxID=1512 RepID=UPI0022E4446C|nr:phage tail tape measure protein [[Clostridium] symbiosum]